MINILLTLLYYYYYYICSVRKRYNNPLNITIMQRQILISATSYPDYYDVDFIVGNSKFIGSVNINIFRKRHRYHLSYMVGGKIFHEYFKDFQSIIDSFLEAKFL